MKTTSYNKLVRDLIPEIIKEDGKKAIIELLTDEKFLFKLDEKLDEELTEYRKSKDIEELADILEVIYAIASAHGYSKEEVEQIRLKKSNERGGFEKRILLVEVQE